MQRERRKCALPWLALADPNSTILVAGASILGLSGTAGSKKMKIGRAHLDPHACIFLTYFARLHVHAGAELIILCTPAEHVIPEVDGTYPEDIKCINLDFMDPPDDDLSGAVYCCQSAMPYGITANRSDVLLYKVRHVHCTL